MALRTRKNNKLRVAVGMSGGVDSSVAAYLLKEQGYDVTGVFMQCWNEKADGCRADEDRIDAVRIAAKLEIPFVSLDFVKEYKKSVISYFYSEYRAGRTPNPDVICNRDIKFGLFLNWALKKGFDYIATGHYARVLKHEGVYKLLKGVDSSKDQSYFLYLLDQEKLSRVIFPLGEFKKEAVRKIAEREKMHVADKPDSVGICFIGEVDIKEFLQKELKPKIGAVINTKGEVLGEHDGIWYYTIGQRHGFRINKYVGLPLYVIGKNVEKNELFVGFIGEANRDTFFIEKPHWIHREPEFPFDSDIRIRHLGELHPSRVETVSEMNDFPGVLSGDLNFLLKADLRDETFGIAPGQSAVFYVRDEVLGGGTIA